MCTETPGELAWEDGPMLKAMRTGQWLLLEDVDLLSHDVLTTLARLRDDSKTFYVGGIGHVPIHGDFRVIGTTSASVAGPAGAAYSSRLEGQTGFHGVLNTFTKATKANIGVVQWMSVPLRPPSIAERHEIIVALHGDIFDASLIHDLLITPFIRFAPAITQAENRHISLRDMLKICQRLRHVANIPSKAQQGRHISGHLRQEILFHCTDILLASLSCETKRLGIARELCRYLGCGISVIDAYLSTELPAFSFQGDAVHVGRAAHKASKQLMHKRTALKDTSLPFAPVRHTMRILERILNCVRFREPIVLTGDTGIGKTHAVSVLADMCCPTKLVVVNLSQNTEYADFIGGWKPRNLMHAFAALFEEFSEKFTKAFDAEKNAPFLHALQQSYAKITSSERPSHADRKRFLRIVSTGCQTALKNLSTLSEQDEAAWQKMHETAQKMTNHLETGQGALSFEYREGVLRECQRKGYWLLLDEVNLAPSEVLDRISAAIESESTDPNFHLFACMNPTGAGKKSLPSSLQTRFTTIFVDEPTEKDDLRLLANFCLESAVESAPCDEIVEFFAHVREQAKTGALTNVTDGTLESPHYSVRSFCRALHFCAKYARSIGFHRALKDGLLMTFATQLSPNHQATIEADIDRIVFKKSAASASGIANLTREIAQFVDCSTKTDRFKIGHFAVPLGPKEPEPMEAFVVTPSVYLHLRNIMRCVVARKPILLQGPTSAGKTSMVEYLARRSGHEFVRINNHKCMEIADYFGQYVQSSDGSITYADGPLVVAARTGAWVVLDELNLAPSDVLEALNRLLDDNRELFVPETQERIIPHPQFHIFATQNPPKWKGNSSYGGRFTLSKAFLNRFMQIRIDDIPADEIAQMLSSPAFALPESFVKRMLKVKEELQLIRSRSNILDGKMSYITPRDLFRWAKRRPNSLQELAGHGLFLFGEKCRKEVDRVAVQGVLSKHCGFGRREENANKSAQFSVQSGFETVCYDVSAWEELKPYLPKLTEVLAKYALVLTDRIKRLIVFVGLCLVHNEPSLLVGETGTGKTTICQIWSEVLERPMFVINCHQHTETSDLIGSFYPVREKTQNEAGETTEKLFEWRDGPVTAAMRNGHLVLLDEINLAEENVIERLNSVLDHSRSLTLTEKGGALHDRIVNAHPNFRIMATMNPGGDFGKKELSAALRNRFSESYVSWKPTPAELEQIVSLRLQKNCKTESIDNNFSDITAGILAILVQQSGHQSMRDILAFVDFVSRTCTSLSDSLSSEALREILSQGQILLHLYANTEDRDRLLEHERTHFIWDVLPHVPSPLQFDVQKVDHSDATLANYFIDANATKVNFSSVLRAMVLDDRPILLEGTAGMGKTSLVSLLSLMYTGKPVVRINLSEQSDWMDLIGAFIPWNETAVDSTNAAASTTFRWNDGILLSAVREGRWVVLDELNLAPQSVLEGLNSLFDHRRSLFLPEFSEYVHAGEGFRIFACQNPTSDGGGRKGLPQSLLNRFLFIAVQSFDMDDLRAIVIHTMKSVGCTSRENSSVLPEAFVNGVLSGISQITTARKVQSNLSPVRGTTFEINLRDTIRWVSLTVAEWNALENFFSDSEEEIIMRHMLHIVYVAIVQRVRSLDERVELIRVLSNSIAHCMSSENLKENYTQSKIYDAFLSSLTAGRWQAVGESVLMFNGTPFALPPDSVFTLDNTMQIDDTFETEHRLLPSQMPTLTALLIASHHNIQPVILTGASGVGKSALIHTAGRIARQTVHSLHLSSGADTIDLLGGFQQATVADGDSKRLFQWKDSLLIQAIEAGEWLILEDANFIPCSVLDRLNPLCEPDGVLVLNEQGRLADGSLRVVRPHPAFRLFFTVNPQYGELSKAMRNRGLELHISGYADGLSDKLVTPQRGMPQLSTVSLSSIANAICPSMPLVYADRMVQLHAQAHGFEKGLGVLFRAARSWEESGNNAVEFERAMRLLYTADHVDGFLSELKISGKEAQLDSHIDANDIHLISETVDAAALYKIAQFPKSIADINLQRVRFSLMQRMSRIDQFFTVMQALLDAPGLPQETRVNMVTAYFPPQDVQLMQSVISPSSKIPLQTTINQLLFRWMTRSAMDTEEMHPKLQNLLPFFSQYFDCNKEYASFMPFENALRAFIGMHGMDVNAKSTRETAIQRIGMFALFLQHSARAQLFTEDAARLIESCAREFFDSAGLAKLSLQDLRPIRKQAALEVAISDQSTFVRDLAGLEVSLAEFDQADGLQEFSDATNVGNILAQIASSNHILRSAFEQIVQSPAFQNAMNSNGLNYTQLALSSYKETVEGAICPVDALEGIHSQLAQSKQPSIETLEYQAVEKLFGQICGIEQDQIHKITQIQPLNQPTTIPSLLATASMWTWLGAAICHCARPQSPIHPDLAKRLQYQVLDAKRTFWTEKLQIMQGGMLQFLPGFESYTMWNLIHERLEEGTSTPPSDEHIDIVTYCDFFVLVRSFVSNVLVEDRLRDVLHVMSAESASSDTLHDIERILSAASGLRSKLCVAPWQNYPAAALMTVGITLLMHGLTLWGSAMRQRTLVHPPRVLLDVLAVPHGFASYKPSDFSVFFTHIDKQIAQIETSPTMHVSEVIATYKVLQFTLQQSSNSQLTDAAFHEALQRLAVLHKVCYQTDADCQTKKGLTVKFYGEGAAQVEEFSTIDTSGTKGGEAYAEMTNTWNIDDSGDEMSAAARNRQLRAMQARQTFEGLQFTKQFEAQRWRRLLAGLIRGDASFSADDLLQKFSIDFDFIVEVIQSGVFNLEGYNGLLTEKQMTGILARFGHLVGLKKNSLAQIQATFDNTEVNEALDVYSESVPAEFVQVDQTVMQPLAAILATRFAEDKGNEIFALLQKQVETMQAYKPHKTPFIVLINRLEGIFKSVHEAATAYNDTDLHNTLPTIAALCLRWRQYELSAYKGKIRSIHAEMQHSSIYERWLPFWAMIRSLIDDFSVEESEFHAEKRMTFFAEADRGFQHAGIAEIGSIVDIIRSIGAELLGDGLHESLVGSSHDEKTTVRHEVRNWLLNKATQYETFSMGIQNAIETKEKQITAMARDFSQTFKWTDKSFHHTMNCIEKSQAFLGRIFHMYSEALMQPLCDLKVEGAADLVEADEFMRRSSHFDALHKSLLEIQSKLQECSSKLISEAENAEKRKALDALRDVLLNARLGASCLPDVLRRWLPAVTTKDISLLYVKAQHPISTSFVFPALCAPLNQRYQKQLMQLGKLRGISSTNFENGHCAALYQCVENLAQTTTANRHFLDLCCLLQRKSEVQGEETTHSFLQVFADSADMLREMHAAMHKFMDYERLAEFGIMKLQKSIETEIQFLVSAFPSEADMKNHVESVQLISTNIEEVIAAASHSEHQSHCTKSFVFTLSDMQTLFAERTAALASTAIEKAQPTDEAVLTANLLSLSLDKSPNQRKRIHTDNSTASEAPHPQYLREIPRSVSQALLQITSLTASIRDDINSEVVETVLADLAEIHAIELDISTSLGAIVQRAAQVNLQDIEENADGAADELQDGTGMGDGEGKKDVTDKLTSEDQLMDAKDIENGPEDENNKQEDAEENKMDVTVTTDFQGNVEEQSDQEAANDDASDVVSDNEEGKGAGDEQLNEADENSGDEVDEEADGDPTGQSPDISTNAQVDATEQEERKDGDESHKAFEADETPEGEAEKEADPKAMEDVQEDADEAQASETEAAQPDEVEEVDTDAKNDADSDAASENDGEGDPADSDGAAMETDEDEEDAAQSRNEPSADNEAKHQSNQNMAEGAGDTGEAAEQEGAEGKEENMQQMPGVGNSFTSFMQSMQNTANLDDNQHDANGEAAESRSAEFAQSLMDFDPSCAMNAEQDSSGASSFMVQNPNDSSAGGTYRRGVARDPGPNPGAQPNEESAGINEGNGAHPEDSATPSEFIESADVSTAQQNEEASGKKSISQGADQLTELTPIEAKWAEVHARTAPLAHVLCENLRTILEPTISDRLRGDYKTGKRLNIKKLIPYIASNFQKDKIWLRRTMPSKRSYQIALVVDDSYSMAVNSVAAACTDCVSVLLTAMHNLEAGELAVLKLGSTMSVCHSFEDTFDCHAVGTKCLEQLTFQQKRSNFQEFLGKSLDYLDAHRLRAGNSSRSTTAEVMQLMFIVSDGQITEDWAAIQALTTRANENNQLVVFILLDALNGGENGTKSSQSVMDMDRIEIDERGKVVRRPYLSDFPFSFYVIVQDIASTPEVVADIVKQWVHASVSSG